MSWLVYSPLLFQTALASPIIECLASADLVIVSADPDHPSGGGQGEDGVRDDETVPRPGDAPEHDPEEPAGAGEHAERDGRAAGQNQQDVRHARQVQGRPHSPSVDVECR